MWAIPTGTSSVKKKKKNQVKSPSPESRVPETGSDPPIGLDRDMGCDTYTSRTYIRSNMALSIFMETQVALIPLLGYGQNIQSDWNINAAEF